MSECPYLIAKGWHRYVGYSKPDGTAGYSCHRCGEIPSEKLEKVGSHDSC